MEKPGSSGLRGLEELPSLAGSTSAAVKAVDPKPSSDSGGSAYGSFANPKITAEKLLKEQASVKTDLEMVTLYQLSSQPPLATNEPPDPNTIDEGFDRCLIGRVYSFPCSRVHIICRVLMPPHLTMISQPSLLAACFSSLHLVPVDRPSLSHRLPQPHAMAINSSPNEELDITMHMFHLDKE